MSLTRFREHSLKDKLREQEEREMAELAKLAEKEVKKLKVGGPKPPKVEIKKKPRKK